MMKNGIKCLVFAIGICAAGCTVTERQTAPSRQPADEAKKALPLRNAKAALPLLAKFKQDMGMAYIEAALGKADLDCGGAVHDLWYKLDDGSSVRIRVTMEDVVLSIERQGQGVSGIEIMYDSSKNKKDTNTPSDRTR